MIELPKKFQNDIQGKDTYLVPLIIIDERIYLSTGKISLDNHYDPLLKSMGSIKESIDIEKKNFKISSVSLDFYNYEYNNETLSGRLFSKSVMNTKLDIYFKSQSAESLEDCLKIYTGYVKDIKETSETVKIESEDKTEQTLHKNLPIEYVRDDIEVPDKYKNARVPLVYGIVEKAPCVYYDLYSTTIENGSRDYAITPDSFAIREIIQPYVFSDDAYGKIRKSALLFDTQKEGTLYANATPDQYIILGNRILVPKSVDVENTQGNISGITSSVTGFGFVEVESVSDLTFNSSKYSLAFRETDQAEQYSKANILAYKDEEGTVPAETIGDGDFYLMVKDFTSDSSVEMPIEEWFWGNNTAFDVTNYAALFAENVINFEANQFFKENSVAKELTKNEAGDKKEIINYAQLIFNLEAQVQETTTNVLPELWFQWTDGSKLLWRMSDYIQNSGTLDNDPYIINAQVLDLGGITVETKNVWDNKFTIGQRQLINDEWVLQDQNGILDWIKINTLLLRRVAVLNNFISYDIYADVEGRVDNVQGKYTQNPQLTSEQRIDYYQGRTITKYKSPIKAFKPIKVLKPIKALKPVKLVKPVKKGTKY